MADKYKVNITSHDYDINKIKNMVTKYRKGKSQGLLESFKEIASNLKGKKGGKISRRKRRKFSGGKKSKYNVKMARKFRRRTRRKRGSGGDGSYNTDCPDGKQWSPAKKECVDICSAPEKWHPESQACWGGSRKRSRRKRGGKCKTVCKKVCEGKEEELNNYIKEHWEEKGDQKMINNCVEFLKNSNINDVKKDLENIVASDGPEYTKEDRDEAADIVGKFNEWTPMPEGDELMNSNPKNLEDICVWAASEDKFKGGKRRRRRKRTKKRKSRRRKKRTRRRRRKKR